MEINPNLSTLQTSWLDTLESDHSLSSLDDYEPPNQIANLNHQEFIPEGDRLSLKPTVRINVGGQEYTDVFGNFWQEDRYFVPDSHKFAQEIEITGTELDPIYQTERFGKNLAYEVPLESDIYDVKLHFAEIYFSSTGKRVFDVKVEDSLLKQDLDLVAEAGRAEAVAIAFNNIQVTDGVLDLDFIASIDNAKLAGIEITPSNQNQAMRINAGGRDYLDEQGKIWQADSYFNAASNIFTRDIAIDEQEHSILLQTERFAKNLTYDIPVENGTYDINLHFAEIYFGGTGKRVFDVSVEDSLVKQDLDLVAEVGKAKSLVVGLNEVVISDGAINLDLIASLDNAKISAIEIIPVKQNLAPVIELDSVLDSVAVENNEITIDQLTDFTGNIIDDDLSAYSVEIAPVELLDLDNLTAADADYISLMQGTATVADNEALFTIDPSLFAKGTYYARVYAQDASSNVSFEGLFLEIDDPAGIYVSTSGTSKGKGTKASPVASFKDACKLLESHPELNTIYVREGIYTNPGYGTGENNKSMAAITCSGTQDKYLTIRPYGNEKVKFAYDSFNGIRIKGNYINFQGFEVEGVAQDITYEEAIADWWTFCESPRIRDSGVAPATGNKKYNGNGIVINGHHVNVRDNIVHDTPGSAIFINDGGDHSNITDNIIYNAAWWSTKGTTAIGMISAKDSKSDDQTAQSIKAERNLIFASESRIFSRVPTKGFAELAIDEGSGTLVQVNDGNYKGDYLIKDNFYLYNGKGVAIARTDNVTVANNTLYMNGSTINGKSTGLRLNGGKDIDFLNNAVVVDSQDHAYSVAREGKDSFVSSQDNYFVGGDNAKELPSGNNLVSDIFTDPVNLDFSLLAKIPAGVGAPIAVFNKLKSKADEYGIKIAPSNWVMNYEQQTKDIIDLVPAGSTLDWSDWSEKVVVHLPAGQNFGGHSEFELRIKTPFTPDSESAS